MTPRMLALTTAVTACMAIALGSTVHAGLVGYWNFDADDASDSSGTGNHGNLVNSPGFSSDVPAISGNVKSLDLNGSGDHVRVPHSASLSIADTMTLSFWINGGSQSAWIRPLSKSDGSSGWELQRTGSNQLQARIDTSAGAQTTPEVAVFDNSWHHVAMTFKRGLWAAYLDGAYAVGGGYGHGAGFANVYDLAIGSASQTYGYGNYDFDGLLDEAAIWDEALPASSIQGLADGTYTPLNAPRVTFTGGDPGEGLDLKGVFVYAVNVGGPDVALGGLTFTSDATTPGVSVSGNAWQGADPVFGTTPADDALEQIMDTLKYHPGTNVNQTIDLANLEVGQEYQLQLLFLDNYFTGPGGRVFGIEVEGEQLLLGFDINGVTGGWSGNPTAGAVLTHTFVATDDTLNIVLLDDVNEPLINAFTLEAVPEPSSLCLSGIALLALGGMVIRRRRTAS